MSPHTCSQIGADSVTECGTTGWAIPLCYSPVLQAATAIKALLAAYAQHAEQHDWRLSQHFLSCTTVCPTSLLLSGH